MRVLSPVGTPGRLTPCEGLMGGIEGMEGMEGTTVVGTVGWGAPGGVVDSVGGLIGASDDGGTCGGV